MVPIVDPRMSLHLLDAYVQPDGRRSRQGLAPDSHLIARLNFPLSTLEPALCVRQPRTSYLAWLPRRLGTRTRERRWGPTMVR